MANHSAHVSGDDQPLIQPPGEQLLCEKGTFVFCAGKGDRTMAARWNSSRAPLRPLNK